MIFCCKSVWLGESQCFKGTAAFPKTTTPRAVLFAEIMLAGSAKLHYDTAPATAHLHIKEVMKA
jgi:hypothetical protein